MVTVNVIRAELGQHVGTAIARIVADELEADWSKVRIHHVDSDPKWGLMVTGGSWSVWQSFPLMSQAGAAGRIALIDEGARLLGVSGRLAVGAQQRGQRRGKSISYGEIVGEGELKRELHAPSSWQAMPIKPAAERRLIGKRHAGPRHPRQDQRHGGLWPRRRGRRAWSTRGPSCRRPATAPRWSRSTTARAKAVPGYLRAIALEDPSATVPGWVMVYRRQHFVAANRRPTW